MTSDTTPNLFPDTERPRAVDAAGAVAGTREGSHDMDDSSSLATITRAAQMLAHAETLDDIKAVRDLATAAEQYARAARLGLQAQNSAATIKLRAERKAGEVLGQLERGQTGPKVISNVGNNSEYRQTLDATGTTYQQANRWQRVAEIPEHVFEARIADTIDAGEELTTHGLLTKAHVAHNSGENEWYTPAEFIDASRNVMGWIDLDPASTEVANAIVCADTFYTAEDDGLAQEWAGRLWMNPPYSSELIRRFADKMAESVRSGSVTQACILVNNATETSWFQTLASVASAVCFPRGRVRFWHPERESAAPLQGQAVIYIGSKPAAFCDEFADFGWVASL